MTFIIDPSTVSRDTIKADLEAWLDIQPDSAKWKDFFKSQVGQTIVELIAGLGAFTQYNAIVGRREAFWKNASNRTSVIAGGESLGYSAFRGRNAVLKLNVTPIVTGILNKFNPVGSVRDQDLIMLADTPLNSGVATDIYVVVGLVKSEDIIINTSNLASFRFTKSLVSDDLRVLLEGVEVNISERILDLINEKFVVQSNAIGSVDVMYLNSSTFATQYSTGDTLTLQWVELKNLDFLSNNVKFDYGTLNSITTESVYAEPETIDAIKINASLFNETQFVIRGRNDYQKIFKQLRSTIVSTEGIDLSPAVVGLYYVKNDLSLFLPSELSALTSELALYRPFGVEPPVIYHPNFAYLNFNVYLSLNNSSGSPTLTVDAVLDPLEKTLGQTISLSDIEDSIEDESFVKIARIEYNTSTWTANNYYFRNAYTTPVITNGFIYEVSSFLYKSSSVEPTWSSTVGDTINDLSTIVGGYSTGNNNGSGGSGDLNTASQTGLVWKVEAIDPLLTLTSWSANTSYNIGDLVKASSGYATVMFRVDSYYNSSATSTEAQKITYDLVPTSGTLRLQYNDGVNPVEDTADIPYNASASQMQTAINALTGLEDVIVTGSHTSKEYDILFAGADSNKTQPEIKIIGTGNNEIQCLTSSLVPNAGQFSLNFSGQITGALNYNISAANLQLALESLINIGVGNILVTGDFNTQFQFEFINTMGNKPLTLMIVNSNTLTAGSTIATTVAVVTEGDTPTIGVNENQRIEFSNIPDAGQFSINYDGSTTTSLPYSATSSQVTTALRALPSINYPTGDVTVTGSMTAGFNIEFTGSLQKTDVVQMTTVTNTLTKNEVVIPTVLTYQQGGGALNEIQKINFSSVPDSGSWVISFTKGGVTEKTDITCLADVAGSLNNKYWLFDTPSVNYYVWYNVNNAGVNPVVPFRTGIQVNIPTNATAEAVKIATITAINTFAIANCSAVSQTVPKLRLYNNVFGSVTDAVDTGLTGFTITVIEQGVNSTFSTSSLAYNITSSALESALEGLTNIGLTNVQVTGDFSNGFVLNFRNGLANQDLNQVVVSSTTLVDNQSTVITISTLNNGIPDDLGVDEVQSLTFNFLPTSGTYQLKYALETTTPIAYNASALDVQNALNALTGLSAVSVSGNASIGYTITFAGVDGKVNQPTLIVMNNTLMTSVANVSLTPCLVVQGTYPANNLYSGLNPVNVVISTIIDALNPEPNWFSGSC